jgi:hypothetical protein
MRGVMPPNYPFALTLVKSDPGIVIYAPGSEERYKYIIHKLYLTCERWVVAEKVEAKLRSYWKGHPARFALQFERVSYCHSL